MGPSGKYGGNVGRFYRMGRLTDGRAVWVRERRCSYIWGGGFYGDRLGGKCIWLDFMVPPSVLGMDGVFGLSYFVGKGCFFWVLGCTRGVVCLGMSGCIVNVVGAGVGALLVC